MWSLSYYWFIKVHPYWKWFKAEARQASQCESFFYLTILFTYYVILAGSVSDYQQMVISTSAFRIWVSINLLPTHLGSAPLDKKTAGKNIKWIIHLSALKLGRIYVFFLGFITAAIVEAIWSQNNTPMLTTRFNTDGLLEVKTSFTDSLESIQWRMYQDHACWGLPIACMSIKAMQCVMLQVLKWYFMLHFLSSIHKPSYAADLIKS